MELYHASTVSIEHPIILNRHTCLDFGTGFYTTANRARPKISPAGCITGVGKRANRR